MTAVYDGNESSNQHSHHHHQQNSTTDDSSFNYQINPATSTGSLSPPAISCHSSATESVPSPPDSWESNPTANHQTNSLQYSTTTTAIDNKNKSRDRTTLQTYSSSPYSIPITPYRRDEDLDHHGESTIGAGDDYDHSTYDPFRVKHRRRTSVGQLKVLEHHYDQNPKPDVTLRTSLSAQLSMTPREVQVWFQNRRAKMKKILERHPDGSVTPPPLSSTLADSSSSAAAAVESFDRKPHTPFATTPTIKPNDTAYFPLVEIGGMGTASNRQSHNNSSHRPSPSTGFRNPSSSSTDYRRSSISSLSQFLATPQLSSQTSSYHSPQLALPIPHIQHPPSSSNFYKSQLTSTSTSTTSHIYPSPLSMAPSTLPSPIDPAAEQQLSTGNSVDYRGYGDSNHHLTSSSAFENVTQASSIFSLPQYTSSYPVAVAQWLPPKERHTYNTDGRSYPPPTAPPLTSRHSGGIQQSISSFNRGGNGDGLGAGAYSPSNVNAPQSEFDYSQYSHHPHSAPITSSTTTKTQQQQQLTMVAQNREDTNHIYTSARRELLRRASDPQGVGSASWTLPDRGSQYSRPQDLLYQHQHQREQHAPSHHQQRSNSLHSSSAPYPLPQKRQHSLSNESYGSNSSASSVTSNPAFNFATPGIAFASSPATTSSPTTTNPRLMSIFEQQISNDMEEEESHSYGSSEGLDQNGGGREMTTESSTPRVMRHQNGAENYQDANDQTQSHLVRLDYPVASTYSDSGRRSIY